MARTEFEALGIVAGNDDGGPISPLAVIRMRLDLGTTSMSCRVGSIDTVSFQVYNPFFAKTLSLVRNSTISRITTVDSAISEWSAPIEIDPFVRCEIARAVPAGYGTAREHGVGAGGGQGHALLTVRLRTFIAAWRSDRWSSKCDAETEAEEDLRPPMPPSGGQRGEESEEEGMSEGEGGDTASEDAETWSISAPAIMGSGAHLDLDPEEVLWS